MQSFRELKKFKFVGMIIIEIISYTEIKFILCQIIVSQAFDP